MNVLFNRSVGNNLYNQRSPEIISFFPHGDNSESVINSISKEFVNSYGKINLELIECLENGEVLEFYGFLGEHNEEMFTSVGLTESDLKALSENGVI